MRMSTEGQKLLKQLEGLSKKVYYDIGGLPTIGIGHLLTRSELTSGKIIIDNEPVRYEMGLTEIQCYSLLSQDLKVREQVVNDFVKVGLKQNQFDALISFIFNIGKQAFINSTLLKMLNSCPTFDYSFVPIQMSKWNKVNGKVVNGLVNRRNKEIELWNKE